MGRNEDLDNALWSDPKFEPLEADAKLLFIWSWSNPHCGMAGVYEVSTKLMGLETALPEQRVLVALDELCASKMVVYAGYLLWVCARVKRLRTRTSQIARSIANDLGKIDPAHPIRAAFMEMYSGEPWLREQLAIIEPPAGWPTAHVTAAVRRTVLERDGFACQYCGSDEKLTIDHRKPRSQGGTGAEDNLQVLCLRCNTKKGPRNDLASIGVIGEPPIEVPLSGSGLRLKEEGSTLEDKDEVDARTRTVSELFAYWQERCGHPNAMLSAERRRKIAGRLREGITPQQVREAIDGARIGAVVSGKKRFDDIELICRNAAKLESFIGREGPPVDDGGANGAKAAQRAVNEKRAAALRELAAGRGVAL